MLVLNLTCYFEMGQDSQQELEFRRVPQKYLYSFHTLSDCCVRIGRKRKPALDSNQAPVGFRIEQATGR
jgi:hypothetical protein